ncbi:MAG: hypothetical protein JWR88_2492 [Pseudonocardia sp.]|nr:hypothetical protein [Pseudonocardia sp.]
MSTVRRCALPGCDVVIELEEGEQPRRYCCPEHRRASRLSRRVQEAAKSAKPPDDRGGFPADGPSLFEPTALELPEHARLRSRPPIDVAPPTVNREQRRRASRRQRAVAVLATTAVFAGAGWAASNPNPNSPAPTPGAGMAMPAPGQPVPVRTAAQWAAEAQQTLDSVNHQLDLIAQTEEMWNRQPSDVRTGPTPAPVQQMLARRAVLHQQRALLQLQLDTFRSLDAADHELGDAERKVAAAERAMPADPAAANSPDARRLVEQRDLLARRRDAKREESASLHVAVEKSVASPLPDRSDQTKPITESVLGLVRDPLRRHPPAEPDKKQPTAVPPRELPSRPKQDVGNVAPPRPGLPPAGTGDAAPPRASTPGSSDSAGATPTGSPPPPNSQPAMTMLDSPGGAEPQPPPSSSAAPSAPNATSGSLNRWPPSPQPRQSSASSDLSQLTMRDGSSSGWVVSRGSSWSPSDARGQLRDAPRGGSQRGGAPRGGGSRGSSRGGGPGPSRR